ncbi:HpcH/HpaI aldolase/citrate lyase family protein [Plantibacter sp. YIM 135249]|uniref:HpcH/HpaI aldolase/citrate lyase family protein n=1 Tax=Plantibacter sp. YIM 135249 TaxID=3423918 RepID=UPI003D33E66C
MTGPRDEDARREPVTGLYVPGSRPDRFGAAASSGADLVILDLEDAVAPTDKAVARGNVVRWLEALPADDPVLAASIVLQVRVNVDPRADLDSLAHVVTPFEIRLPKVESVEQLDRAAERAGGRPITALLESALGVERAVDIAAHPSVTRLALGESDLRSELGTAAPEVIDYARVRLLYAAVAAGLPAPMLSAYPAIRDVDGLFADTVRGRGLGWFGRTAIHPTQLPVIARAFAPDAAELVWAEAVLAALTDGGVAVLSTGEMVDAAMLGRARSILRRSPQPPTPTPPPNIR